MSKKDYIATAAILRSQMDRHSEVGPVINAVARTTVREIADGLADHFAQSNPRFNKTLFMDAAGCI